MYVLWPNLTCGAVFFVGELFSPIANIFVTGRFCFAGKKNFLNVSLVQVCKAYPLPAFLPEGSQLKKSEISGLNAVHPFLQAICFF